MPCLLVGNTCEDGFEIDDGECGDAFEINDRELTSDGELVHVKTGHHQ